ncbi:hypothetical protein NITHO_5240006 [Nitrolancea hollandica Lb]|uniref:Uncharacterized protein n=2 Tax=Nitrolancea hollandica TaxID=1206749 RepID=I4ELQ7_9BACT|nr:hypothetical protein NITHO_5240006 [Nitrolancea hollandica Lb]
MVDHIHEYEDELEAEAAFNWRDAIKVALDAGAILDGETMDLLAQADDRLMARREALVRRFPNLFHPERKAEIPKAYWWWYLDEGPRVRAA